MSSVIAPMFAGLAGGIVGFTLGQFFNLSLVTWKGKPLIPHVGKRKRTRKLPWMKVVGMFMLLAILYTVISNQLFQEREAFCNAEQRRVMSESGKAATEDNELQLRGTINLGVTIRALLGSPQPQTEYTQPAVDSLNRYLAERNIRDPAAVPPALLSEVALDWYQIEQQKTVETFIKNNQIRSENPYPEARCENV